ERADALGGVEPHQRSTKARQAIYLLIGAQCHLVEASILVPAVVPEMRVRGEPPRAEEPLAGQRGADEIALAAERGLTPARDAGNLDVPLEDDDPRPAIRPSLRHFV